MMARAVSKEMGFRFLVVKPSVVNNKWVGESEKTIQAIFSLGIGFQTNIWYVAYDIISTICYVFDCLVFDQEKVNH